MSLSLSQQQVPIIKFGAKEYLLPEVGHDGVISNATQAERSGLLRFDDEDNKKIDEYEYPPLPVKRIRLLQLLPGTLHERAIYCKLVEADYNNSFHIPTRPRNAQPQQPALTGKAKLLAEAEDVKRHEIKYEALSWCWGTDFPSYAVYIEQNGLTYKKRVRKDLALALKYLRLSNKTRTLWIDAICIDQDNPEERNQQVQMMSRVYTRADEVCIWLGEDSDESQLAIDFISHDITQLKNFDAVSSDKKYTDKWQALMMLMQRDWFSRRWVVQEISLAKKAKIYCGPYSIPWKEFAVAVELFVEVETATHRLSEVMQKDEKFRHVPGWFEYVSELGASLLVQATGKVFRAQRTPLDDKPDDLDKPKDLADKVQDGYTIDPLDRRSLLSLEYLVTTMFIFKATECRDSIYSMLAIARDAAPFAESATHDEKVSLTMTLFDCFLAEKPFKVDYARPYSDVCRDFVEFCIQRKSAVDPVQALDILCRPWALDAQAGQSIRLPPKTDKGTNEQERFRTTKRPREQWKKRIGKVLIEKVENLVEGKLKVSYKYRYEYEEPRRDEDDPRVKEIYWKDADENEAWKHTVVDPNDAGKTLTIKWKPPEKSTQLEELLCLSKPPLPQQEKNGASSKKQAGSDLELPSWVSRASQAPFALYSHPGIHILKTGRANADPLVGPPQDGHRNYSAAQTEAVRLDDLKFRKRKGQKHYSLYVKGFNLDEVVEVRAASQGGNIPREWLELGGWSHPYSNDPPAAFWRTIVADRGHDNRNPPYYYARACKESVDKGGIASGIVNTTALINNERNSIIAEFCRRVHAVIWGRSLFKTKRGKLGLAANVAVGDEVCILYGCTVPIILKKVNKNPGEREKEMYEDHFESFRSCMRRLERICVRQDKYNLRNHDADWKKSVEDTTEEVNSTLEVFKKNREANKKVLDDQLEKLRERMERKAKRKRTNTQAEEPIKDKEANDDTAKEKTPAKTAREIAREIQEEQEGCWYEFKGESYLHGFMDGEALRLRFYEPLPDRVYELR